MSLSREDQALVAAKSFITFLLTGRIPWTEELDLDLSAELMNTNQYSKWVEFAKSIKYSTRQLFASQLAEER